jgi:uncharacterized protein
MRRFRLAATLASFTMVAACAPPAEPTPAQRTIVQPGIEAEERGDYGFALFTYRYWANWQVGLAQYRLARLHEQGLGTERDYAEAAKWYRAASENGYRPAHRALARLYEQGRGVPQDHAAAFELYEKAAAGGDVAARDHLGRLLELGHGAAADASAVSDHARADVAPDPTRTVDANRDGAQQGDGVAAFEVAAAFEHGHGVPPDLVEALAWYVIAQRHGYAPATPHAAVLAEELPSAEVREASRRVDLWWREFGS